MSNLEKLDLLAMKLELLYLKSDNINDKIQFLTLIESLKNNKKISSMELSHTLDQIIRINGSVYNEDIKKLELEKKEITKKIENIIEKIIDIDYQYEYNYFYMTLEKEEKTKFSSLDSSKKNDYIKRKIKNYITLQYNK